MHSYFKNIRNIIASLILVSALAACGGGSSNSNTPATSDFNGTQTFTISANGITDTNTAPIGFKIDGNTISLVENGNVLARASLSGSNFTFSDRGTNTANGVTCTLNLNYTGTVAGNNITGSISGGGPCSSQGQTINVSIRGNFNASK